MSVSHSKATKAPTDLHDLSIDAIRAIAQGALTALEIIEGQLLEIPTPQRSSRPSKPSRAPRHPHPIGSTRTLRPLARDRGKTFSARVTIQAYRTGHGRMVALVSPVEGDGEAWVAVERLTD